MNIAARNAISAYQQVGVDNKVLDASPHELIAMLYDAALTSLFAARVGMENRDLGGKGRAISKAIGIIDEGLKVSLDYEAGGELAVNLGALYDYMADRLLQANLKNDLEILQEVIELLAQLKGAWDGIGGKTETAPAADTDTPPQEAESHISNRA